MDKHTARGLSLGFFITAIVLLVFKQIFLTDPSETVAAQEASITEETIVSFLEEKELIVISKDDYDNLKGKENNNVDKDSTQSSKNDNQQVVNEKSKQPSEKKEEIVQTYEITITKGMVSGDVAYLLKKKGLITNQSEFSKRLESSGAAKYVQIGTHTLDTSMDINEIIRVITKNRI